MIYVVAALVLVGAIASLNLLLTLGVIRRLREHAEKLASGPAGRSGPPDMMLPVGERPAEFRAEAVDGTEVSLASLVTPTLVGFFSPSCEPCKEWVPRFAKAAGALPQGRRQALAVVVGNGGEASGEVAELRRVALVVVEPFDGPVSRAFAVKGWPVLCRLGEDGAVATTDSRDAVSVPAPT